MYSQAYIEAQPEVEKLFTEEHAGFAKGTHYHILSLTTRLIGQDAAVQDWVVELTGMKGPDDSPVPPPPAK